MSFAVLRLASGAPPEGLTRPEKCTVATDAVIATLVVCAAMALHPAIGTLGTAAIIGSASGILICDLVAYAFRSRKAPNSQESPPVENRIRSNRRGRPKIAHNDEQKKQAILQQSIEMANQGKFENAIAHFRYHFSYPVFEDSPPDAARHWVEGSEKLLIEFAIVLVDKADLNRVGSLLVGFEDNYHIYFKVAMARAEEGDFTTALKIFFSHQAWCWIDYRDDVTRLVELLVVQDRFEDAEKVAGYVTGGTSENWRPILHSYLDSGNIDEALRAVKSLEYTAANAQLHFLFLIARILVVQGDVDRARETVASLDPVWKTRLETFISEQQSVQ